MNWRKLVCRIIGHKPKVERLKSTVPVIWCKRWRNFKERSKGASSVTLEWTKEKGLTISAISHETVYKYVFGADGFKSWLSWELDVPEKRVIEGEIIVPGGKVKKVAD